MTTFGEKMRSARVAKDLLQKDLAEKLGVRSNSISNWEKDQNYPDIETIAHICDILEVSASYLIEDCDKLNQETMTPPEQAHIKKYRTCDERGRGMVDTVLDYEYNRTMDLLSKNDGETIEPNISVIVPYESAAAGFGNYLSDSSYEKIEFPVSKVPNGTDYGIRISGDSMNPTIPKGCIAFVRCRPAIENGKIGIFNLNGEGFCKRLEVDSENHIIWLVSDNDKYEPIKIKASDYLHTYGEVLGWGDV